MQPNYEPQQPDTTLVPAVPPKPKKHPVRRAICCILVVLCTILLMLVLTGNMFLAAIRRNVTPEYVYTYADTLDYLHFPLPDTGTPDTGIPETGIPDTGIPEEDSYFTISELMQENFAAVGFSLTDADMELIFDQFSIPTIFAGYAQDVVSWLLFDGPRPVLDADEIAATALSGVDDSLLMVLYILGDPVELVSGFLTEPLSNLDTAGMFDAMEPVRFCLSRVVLDLVLSVLLMLMVLLFCLCRCRFYWFLLPNGVAFLGAGALVEGIPKLLTRLLPQRLPVYASYLTSFFEPMVQELNLFSVIWVVTGVGMLVLAAIKLFDPVELFISKVQKLREDRDEQDEGDEAE